MAQGIKTPPDAYVGGVRFFTSLNRADCGVASRSLLA